MAVSIQQLEEDWLNYKPAGNRPLGGRRALSGFNYQLNISLDSFIDKVLKGDVNAAMAFDGLTDVAKLEDDLVYLTQVKTTLRTQSIKDAIDEFLAVDAFLESRYNDLRRNVRYQIVCRATEGRVNQNLSARDLNLSPSEGKRWKQLRKQLLPYSVQGDPTLELVIRLWDKVSKPFDFVSSLRGDLVQMLGINQSSDKISEHLLQRWQQSKTTSVPPGNLLSPSHFHNWSKGKTHVLVGQRPTLRDVSEGCFMERPELLQEIIETLQTVSERTKEKLTRRIPMVWINGGSGVGKSTLLLQTMQRLVTETDAPVSFLRHFPDQLPKSLEFWGKQSIPTVIAVDDIYAPTYRSPGLWSEINRLAYDAPYLTILTCGPTNYREAFEQQNQREGAFEVLEVNVPALNKAERERYLDWYSVRTEQLEVKPINETNFVIAAFVLERRRQGDVNIQEFTARLNHRVESLDVAGEFYASLAVNTLGIEAPMSIFDGKRDAVSQFLKDGLCQVEEKQEQHESVRWFHPALARRIYDFLVPAEKVEARAINLERYFNSVINDPHLPYAFLKLLKKNPQRLISEEVTREVLKRIGRTLERREPPDLRIGLMFAWIENAQHSGLQPDRFIQKDRIITWMNSPAINAQAWGLLWEMVWDVLTPEEKDHFLPQTLLWLKDNHDLPETNFVWQRLWKERTGDADLIELAKAWLVSNSNHSAWTYVFQALYHAGVREHWLVESALEGLAHSPVSVADKYIWPLVETLEPPLELLLLLVTKRLCNSRISYISDAGFKFIDTLASNIGTGPVVAALSAEKDSTGWAFIFQRSTERWKRDPVTIRQLIALGRDWLGGREERPEWNYIWQRLVNAYPDDEDLLEQGREWLVDRENRPEWAYIWQRLVHAYPHDEDLLEQGREWLIDRENRPEWSHVWRKLMEIQPSEEMFEKGHQWLSGREDQLDWTFVWRRLLHAQPDNPDLLRQGREWLIDREYQPGYSYVRQKLTHPKF